MDSLPITTPTVLLGAADLIRKRGWARFTMQNHDGAMCIRGAIRRYLAETLPLDSDPVVYEAAIEAAEQRANRALHMRDDIRWPDGGTKPRPYPGSIIAPWNDLVCQSQDEAVRVLESAALAAVA